MPAGRIKDNFLTHTGLMFFATAVVNFSTMLYHLFMVRKLPPADYAAVNSLVAILMIIGVPAGTIQTGLINFTSKFFAQGELGKIKFILKEISKQILSVAFILFLIIILGRNYITNFLRLDSSTPLVLIAWSILLTALLPVVLAGIQGVQKFINLAVISITGGLSKLVISAIVVLLGYGVSGAIAGILLSGMITLLVALFSLKLILKQKSQPESGAIKKLYLYFLPVGVSLFCLMALTGSDIILVKHYFSPLEAGYYSVASMVGKIILFLPGAITIVMFPKTSYLLNQNNEREALNLLKKSLGYVAFLCGSAVLVCVLFTPIVIKLLSGEVYIQSLPIARLFAVAMFFFAMFSIILYYQLSSGRTNFIYPLIILTLLQVALIIIFHRSLLQVVSILAINSCILFLTNLKLVFQENMI